MRASDDTTAKNLHTGDGSDGRHPHPAPAAGDRVRMRGYHWRVVDVRAFAACSLVDLAGIEAENLASRARLLTPFDRAMPLTAAASLRPVRAARVRLALAALAGAGVCRAAASARIDVVPYQLDPALALLRGDASRLLLADEVGLGKTVQAGIAIAELRVHGRADRVLILTPAGLREQWIAELSDRFRIDATPVDASVLRQRVAAIPRAVNPWRTWPVAVASIDFAKRPDVLPAMAGGGWDVLVVDEAHTVATAPDRHAAVERLASAAPYVLLLTATPHNGSDHAYDALCRLGRHGDEDALIRFRRTRRHAGIRIDRRVHLLRVALTAAERRMHRALTAYARRVIADARRRGDRDAVLAMIVLTKRALSGAASLERSVDRRLRLLSQDDGAHGLQMALPLGMHADPELDPADDEPGETLGAAGLDDADEERVRLERLRTLAADAARDDSKLRVVRTLIRRAREPVIVFTEYRDTLAALERALAPHDPVTLHGGVEAGQRARIAGAFSSGHHRLLLATDVASEGLNLHAHCRIVVCLELPWTPARLEQRIGRVDRIGQRRRVHAFNLLADGTAETGVLRRLVRRLETMRRRLGEVPTPVGHVSDEVILQAAVAAHPLAVTIIEDESPPASSSSRESRAAGSGPASRDEAARIARWRTMWGRLTHPREVAAADLIAQLEASAPWMAIERRPTVFQPGLLAVFRVRMPLGAGRASEDLLIPLHVAAPALVRTIAPRDARACVRALIPELTRRAAREAARRSRRLVRQAGPWRRRLAARVSAMAAARDSGPAATQGRLFQRRGADLDRGVHAADAGANHDTTSPPPAPPELLVVFVLASR